MKAVVLIENRQQLDIFLKQKLNYNAYNEIIICAFTPVAIAACERTGQKFVVPEDYYNSDEYLRVGKDSFLRTAELISFLDGYYQIKSEEKIGFGLAIGSYYAPLLYIILGTIHSKIFQLQKIIDAERPDLILSFRLDDNNLFLSKSFFFHPLETIYADLLVSSPFKGRCKFIKCNLVGNFSLGRHLLGRWRKILTCFYRNIKTSYFCVNELRKRNNLRKAVFLSGGYDWKFVTEYPKFKKNFLSFYFFTEDMPFTGVCRNNHADIGWLKWDDSFYGFKTLPLLFRRIKTIDSTFLEYLNAYPLVKAFLKDKDVVLSPFLLYPKQHLVAHLANEMNIPVVVWCHGEKGCSGNIGPIDEMEDVLHATYFFAFGSNATRIYNDKFLNKYPYFKGAVSVGSVEMDNVSKLSRLNPDKDYILYATGKYFLNAPVFGADPPVSDNRLYYFQKEIVSYLEKLKNRVIWKLHPLPFCGDKHVETRRVEKIYNKKTFTSLLKAASLVILDAPSTTCLQAASSNKPLFILQGYIVFSQEALGLLSKRAIIANSPQDLIKEVQFYLETGEYKADVNNREFVKAFATHFDDGRSLERAVDFIFDVSGIRNN